MLQRKEIKSIQVLLKKNPEFLKFINDYKIQKQNDLGVKYIGTNELLEMLAKELKK